MDIKTLSTIIGHISSATTLNIHTHITDNMQLQAANKIEQGIGNSEAYEPHETIYDQVPVESANRPRSQNFSRTKARFASQVRVGIYEINDHLYAGRYSPTNAHGKREVYTVYTKPVRNVKSCWSR